MIIEILNEMAKKQGKESAEKENEKSELREEKYKLLNEVRNLILMKDFRLRC
jgi:large-conductance mechanosensitive channel